MSLYALPLIGGAGLGNGLFPWARAELFARSLGIPVLAPRWGRLRIGPYLRREPEKRRYGGAFDAPEHVHGFSRVILGSIARRMREDRPTREYRRANAAPRPFVVAFEGIGTLFAPLLEEHRLIKERLWAMTTPPLRSTGGSYGAAYIAMHVRRGDITRQGFSAKELEGVNQYTPLSWFISMAHAVKRCAPLRDIPIVVFTDGSHDEVADLCRIDGVLLHRRVHAVSDLWTLAHAALLFASGYSTFGMWASFLGGMPTFYAPGKMQQAVQRGRSHGLECEVPESGAIPDEAVAEFSGRGGRGA